MLTYSVAAAGDYRRAAAIARAGLDNSGSPAFLCILELHAMLSDERADEAVGRVQESCPPIVSGSPLPPIQASNPHAAAIYEIGLLYAEALSRPATHRQPAAFTGD